MMRELIVGKNIEKYEVKNHNECMNSLPLYGRQIGF